MSQRYARATSKLAWALLFTGSAGMVVMAPPAAIAATTGVVQGIVTNSEGQPLPNVKVSLDPTDQTTTTGSDGRYTFVGVQPSNYTVAVDRDGFQSAKSAVTVVQDQASAIDFKLEPATAKTATSRIVGQAVARSQTATTQVITEKSQQETKSQPNSLYGFTGLLFGMPGVTYDPSGYPHIRGSDITQVGYDVDGISIVGPLDNIFATNAVAVGLKSANFYTGGRDASYGNAIGGFLNEVTANGRDLRGGSVEGTFGPGHGWNYSGTNVQYGDVTPNGKLDYYGSIIAFKNKFPGNTQVQSLNSSFDGVLKANYYVDPNNTVSAFYGHGFEQYDTYYPNNSSNYDPDNGIGNLKFDDQSPTSSLTGIPGTKGNGVYENYLVQPHDDQSYDLAYASIKHNFSPSSFLTYRAYALSSFITVHGESKGGAPGSWQQTDSHTVGHQLDYTNQINATNQLRAGFAYIPSTTSFNHIEGIYAPFDQQSPSGYKNRYNDVKPTRTVLYLNDVLKPAGDKLTVSLGGHYENMQYDLQRKGFSNFSDHYLDPRLGAAYSPNRDLVFRTSYSVNSQFPETEFLGYEAPLDSGHVSPTATDPVAQQKYMHSHYSQYNKLGASHSNDFDLGVEKALTVPGSSEWLGGPYTVSLTGFKRRQYDLLQANYNSYTGNPYPTYYNNDSTGHASGFEFVLQKRAKKTGDLNGFFSYTNSVIKASSSDYDTQYIPYFASYVMGRIPSGSLLTEADFDQLNRSEFPTSYDQRHTVAALVNKRFGKHFEESAILDAGSGFPFSGGTQTDGQSVIFGADPQHSDKMVGAEGEFAEVPTVLLDNKTLQPLNPTVGWSGWHFKISLNTTYHLTEDTSLFLNVDNIFDSNTIVNYATANQAGAIYYSQPTAQYPQGRVYYGPAAIISPIFLSFGFRQKF